MAVSKKNTSSYNTGGNTTTYNNGGSNYGGKVDSLLKGSVILCTHGITANQHSFDELFKYVNSEYLFYNIYALKPVSVDELYLTQDNAEIDEVQSKLVKLINDNPNKNIMISVSFGEDYDDWGKIETQADFMNTIVNGVKTAINKSDHKNYPLILLGHSKGGLVNMNCALKNISVKKLISVGTPYNGTIVDNLISFALFIGSNMAQKALFKITDAILDLIDSNRKTLSDKLGQALIAQTVVDPLIATKWRNRYRYIPCTAIGTDAVEFPTGYTNFSGDYVVPLKSANGSVLTDVKSFEISDGKVVLNAQFIKDAFSESETFANLIHLLADAAKASNTTLEFGLNLLKLLFKGLKEVFEAAKDMIYESMKIAHYDIVGQGYSQLNHLDVVLRIVAGINA